MKTFSQFIKENRFLKSSENAIRRNVFNKVYKYNEWGELRLADYPDAKKLQDKVMKMVMGGVGEITPLMGRQVYDNALALRITKDKAEDAEIGGWFDGENTDDPYFQKDLEAGRLYKYHNVFKVLNHVDDWFQSDPEGCAAVIMGLPNTWEAFRSLSDYADKYFVQKQKNADEGDVDSAVTFMKAENGFRWVELKTEGVLNREGKLMQHCVGSYFNRVRGGDTIVLSLWDKENQPHVTIELATALAHDGKRLYRIDQVKGKQNRGPDIKYREYVIDFLNEKAHGWALSEEAEEDLQQAQISFHEYPDKNNIGRSIYTFDIA